MKLKKSLIMLGLSMFSLSVFFACNKKDSTGGKAKMQVYLTDDPGNYDAVFIDVADIRINYSNDTANGWQSLGNVQTGAYDILKLVNDQDTLLSDAEINTGQIQQIRLILGSNNYVKIGGQTYPLETPSAQQSGLKLNIHQDVTEGLLYKLLLDFDAGRSIVKTGNNRYILKPVIRTTLTTVGGSIKGYVKPSTLPTSVYAIQGTDTIAGTYTSAGNYLIKGLNAGSYNLSFVPSDYPTHNAASRTGISVQTNMVTTVDTVTLQ